jgi:7-cyano-7-deazaguanine synthase
MRSKDLAVVLVSGGIDSCVTTAIANKNHNLALLHINYSQTTEKRELKAFEDIVKFYSPVKKLICHIDVFKKVGGSTLIKGEKFSPQLTAEIPATYVPFRNGIFLSFAVIWAEVLEANKIFIGAVREDAPEYPDTRREFYTSFNEVIKIGTKPESKIKIFTPIIHLTKAQVIKIGIKLGAPLHLTWSCYREERFPCKQCNSCKKREKAFKQAGIKDPLD